jgi:ribosomal protein L11 methyltransferase
MTGHALPFLDTMLAFRFTVSPQDEDIVTTLLWEMGTQGVEVTSGARERATLLAYFGDRPGLAKELRAGLARIVPGCPLEEVEVPHVDWIARFRASFAGFEVGGFRIAPPWEVSPLDHRDQRLLVVDPGGAFGTGTHETTQLCLGFLETLAHGASLGTVLDLGTGTGLLSVAAVRLGADRVVAVDIDPEAVRSARHHCQLNAVEVHVVQGDGGAALAPGSFDLVLANLTTRQLLEHRSEIRELCTPPGGDIVLAGLLTEDLECVCEAYESLGPIETRVISDWAGILVRAS